MAVKAVYLLFFPGKYVSSGMNSNQIFSTLSIGIVFTGIAAGFVEEMVFRGVILLDSKVFAFTGGEFGIESSIIALLGYTIVTLAAIYMIKKREPV